MKKMINILLFVSLVIAPVVAGAASFGFPYNPRFGDLVVSDTASFSGTADFSGDVESTKACASGFVRVMPSLCLRDNGSFGAINLTRDTCVSITSPDTEARALVFRIDSIIDAANSVALRQNILAFWEDSGCSVTELGSQVDYYHNAYEWTALAAGTLISRQTTETVIPLEGENITVYGLFSDDAGNQGQIIGYVVGYYD